MTITIEPAGNASFVYRCLQTTLMVNTLGNHTLASFGSTTLVTRTTAIEFVLVVPAVTHIDQSQSALHFAGMRAFHTLNKKSK